MEKRGQRNSNLSRAIQACIADLVDTMPFRHSEIPDILIQEGCITEDECNEIREKTNRKDQVRKLVLLIKGRGFDIMKKYLDAMNTQCPSTVNKVWTEYEILRTKNIGPWKCPVCELKEGADVKYVADILYGKAIIGIKLYSMICHNSDPPGQQDYLWDSIVKACTGNNLKYLTDALKAKGHYNHIADSLNIYHRGISNDIYCQCSEVGPPAIPRKIDSDETESDTTYSPKSTPLTSTKEDESTSTNTLCDNSSDDSTVNAFSDQQSLASEATIKANTEGDERTICDDKAELASTTSTTSDTPLTSRFLKFMCCRSKRTKRDSYELQSQ